MKSNITDNFYKRSDKNEKQCLCDGIKFIRKLKKRYLWIRINCINSYNTLTLNI